MVRSDLKAVAVAAVVLLAPLDPAMAAGPPIARPSEIARAILPCWRSTGDGDVTFSVSFRRDGSVIGVPRITYAISLDPAKAADLRWSIMDAVRACTPLVLTRGLRDTISGQVLRTHFVRRNDHTIEAATTWTGT